MVWDIHLLSPNHKGILTLFLPGEDIGGGTNIYTPAGNAHNANKDAPLAQPEKELKDKNKKKDAEGGAVPSGEEAPPEEPAKKKGRKEKSVLQAKLTKLAIQIGYAGLYIYSSKCVFAPVTVNPKSLSAGGFYRFGTNTVVPAV